MCTYILFEYIPYEPDRHHIEGTLKECKEYLENLKATRKKSFFTDDFIIRIEGPNVSDLLNGKVEV
jgi:hypothetical protein